VFKVIVTKIIQESVDSRSKLAVLRREVLLPFAPFAGLQIGDRSYLTSPIRSVTFSIGSQCFEVEVAPEYEFDAEDDDPIPSGFFEHLVESARAEGWSVVTLKNG